MIPSQSSGILSGLGEETMAAMERLDPSGLDFGLISCWFDRGGLLAAGDRGLDWDHPRSSAFHGFIGVCCSPLESYPSAQAYS